MATQPTVPVAHGAAWSSKPLPLTFTTKLQLLQHPREKLSLKNFDLEEKKKKRKCELHTAALALVLHFRLL